MRSKALKLGIGLFVIVTLAPSTLGGQEAGISSLEPGLVSRPLGAVPADSAALILTGREGGNLPAAVLAFSSGAGGVGLVVELDGQSLLGNETRSEVEVEIIAYAFGTGGGVEAHLAETVVLDVDRVAGTLYDGGLRLVGGLAVGPGAYRVRVLARDRHRRGFSLRDVVVEVAAGGTEPALGPLLVRENTGSWLLVRQSGADSAREIEGVSALPVLRVGERIAAVLPGGQTLSPSLRLSARFADLEGRPVAEADLAIAEGSPPVLRFRVPDLQAGAYGLQVMARAGPTEVAAAPVQQVVVTDSSAAADVSWPGLAAGPSHLGRTELAGDLDLSGSQRRSARSVGQAYFKVLETLASGAWEEAAADLHSLETEVFAEVAEEPNLLLARGQMTVINRLADFEVESLVPIMVVHLELQRRYVEERRLQIASHTDSLVTALAEIYAERAQSDLGPSLAADVLASVGAYLQSARLSLPGRRMLSKALALDERSPFALLQLAVGHESRGEYDEAIGYLRRLLEVRPDSHEGRLRLALNLQRRGEAAEAARLLDHLLWSGAAEEILVVAYQERARIELESGRPQRASSLLEEAAARLPRHPRLRIQLAYALDRAGDPAAAYEAVHRLEERRALAGRSPRFLYGRALVDPSEVRLPSFDDAALSRLPALAVALERVSRGGGG